MTRTRDAPHIAEAVIEIRKKDVKKESRHE